EAVADRKDLYQPSLIDDPNAEERGEAAPIEGSLLHPWHALAIVELAKFGDCGGEPCAGEFRVACIASHQDARPGRRVKRYRGAVGKRIHTFARAVEAVLVPLVLENLRNGESQWQAQLWLRIGFHRSATSLGRVPISKKSTMHCGSPLKMK